MTRVGKEPTSLVSSETKWDEAFESDLFKSIVRRRSGFVTSALIVFSAFFFVLWVMQSSFPAISAHRVYGWINVNFVYTMSIFPVVWVMGFVFVRYTRREVYPLEDELRRRFTRGPDE